MSPIILHCQHYRRIQRTDRLNTSTHIEYAAAVRLVLLDINTSLARNCIPHAEQIPLHLQVQEIGIPRCLHHGKIHIILVWTICVFVEVIRLLGVTALTPKYHHESIPHLHKHDIYILAQSRLVVAIVILVPDCDGCISMFDLCLRRLLEIVFGFEYESYPSCKLFLEYEDVQEVSIHKCFVV